MTPSIEMQIEEHEEKLRQAMLQSDIHALDELLAPDLIFVNHLGHCMSKQDDIEAHRTGNVNINQITLFDQQLKPLGDIAIVCVQAHILGSFAGTISQSDLRFTRVWRQLSAQHWQLIAAHASMVV